MPSLVHLSEQFHVPSDLHAKPLLGHEVLLLLTGDTLDIERRVNGHSSFVDMGLSTTGKGAFGRPVLYHQSVPKLVVPSNLPSRTPAVGPLPGEELDKSAL